MMEENMLLETHLKSLRLPTFLANYRKFAQEAAQAGHAYDRFLLALAEHEVAQRERNRIALPCAQGAGQFRFLLHCQS
jgi:hypothetical protein